MFSHYYKPKELLFGWRVYFFDQHYQAEDFSEMFNGVVQFRKDVNNKWVVLI